MPQPDRQRWSTLLAQAKAFAADPPACHRQLAELVSSIVTLGMV